MQRIKVDSKTISNMPVGFYGKFCTEINNERHTWFIQSLVNATKHSPIVEVKLDELEFCLDENAWFHEKNKPTLRAFIQHYKRVDEADLSFPIIINPTIGVLDGLHRVAKAHVLGHKTIKAVILNELPEPDYIGDF
ncbi:MAG: hypothetical protein AB8B80_14965 [Marinicellaceae bacterium]